MKRFLSFLTLTFALLLLPTHTARADLSVHWIEGPALTSLRASDVTAYDWWFRGINEGTATLADLIADDVTLTVHLDLNANLPSLGAAGPSSGIVSYSDVQARLPALLPPDPPRFAVGSSQQAVDPSRVSLTSAQMKRLGVFDTRLREQQADGVIYLSTLNAFDNDASDGISPGSFPLGAVVAHELLHIAGIVSIGDAIAPNSTDPTVLNPTLWDFFRFESPGVHALNPEARTYLSLDGGQTDNGWTLARGLTTGGPQASHLDLPAGAAIITASMVAGLPVEPTDADRAAVTAAGWTVRQTTSEPPAGAGEPSAGGLVVVAVVVILSVFWLPMIRTATGTRSGSRGNVLPPQCREAIGRRYIPRA